MMKPTEQAKYHFEYARLKSNHLQGEKTTPIYIEHLAVAVSNIAHGLKELSEALAQTYTLLEEVKKSRP